MNREQYISHLRTVACGLHLDGIQKWADLIVENIHWVKVKTLTDEEIHNIYVHMSGKAEGISSVTGKADFPVLFARAIEEWYGIKEAGEK